MIMWVFCTSANEFLCDFETKRTNNIKVHTTVINQHAPVGIIGAMPQEVMLLTEQLDAPQKQTVAGITWVSGVLNDTPVVVMQCGIGKVNAAIGATLLIERFSPSAIINTGSAGGIGENLSVGDTVIGESVSHHDVDVTAFGYAIGQMAQMPVNYPSAKSLMVVAQQVLSDMSDKRIHCGQIVSGDCFVNNREHFALIRKNFPTALAVEMEAAAIAQTCYRFDVPFIVIRAISDLADEQAPLSFDEFIVQAGERSAELVISMLARLQATS